MRVLTEKDNQIKLMQLRNYQAMPLGAKVRLSEVRIREWYEAHGGLVYIALSGGWDSCVMAEIVWSLYPKVPAVFCDTGNELDSVLEQIEYLKERGKPIITIKPKISFEEIVTKYGYPILSKTICMGIDRFVNTKSFTQKRLRAFGGINPTSGKKQQRSIPKKYHFVLRAVLAGKIKTTNKCCKYLKIDPIKPYEKETGRKPFVGTMAEESNDRMRSFLKLGCNAFKSGASRPIIFWTHQDVLKYARDNFLRMATAYAEKKGGVWTYQREQGDGSWKLCGDQRTGCKLCLFGIQFETGENRIQRLARVEPETYRYAIDVLHYDGILDFLGIEWRPINEL